MESKLKTILSLLRQKKIDQATAQRLIKKIKQQHRTQPEPAPSPAATQSDAVGEDLAVIGMSGKFPGAPDIDTFWKNIRDGVESVTEIPEKRWNWKEVQEHSYSKWGGFIKDVDRFDPAFFNYSPLEAENMDPQHRLMLQEFWRSIESAGYNPYALNNTRCGVYVGVMNHDYFDGLMPRADEELNAWELMGNSSSILASRIAYFLNLRGPAIAIDTACSSSLVATHLAAKALHNREIDMALVGGVTLYLNPRLYKLMSKARMLSPTGACKTFDNEADGIVVGEGAVAIALKRLSDAERDGDNILSVIKGSGINQDGKTNGITAPSGLSQTALLEKVYREAEVSPGDVSYIEAHGTGTKLGDPVEFNALAKIFTKETHGEKKLGIGSVKSNIGHTSAASGLVSLIKCTKALNEQVIPPSLHFSTPNQHIDMEATPFYVPVIPKAWKKGDAARMAGISSFGFSGTNAHLILSEYQPSATRPATVSHPAYLFAFSGKSKESLHKNIEKFRHYLGTAGTSESLTNISYTLLNGRAHFGHRVVFTADTHAELESALNLYLKGNTPGNCLHSEEERADDGVTEKGNQLLQVLSLYLAKGQVNAERFNGLLQKAASFYVAGADLQWNYLFKSSNCKRLNLPVYQFDEQAYWTDGLNTEAKGNSRPALSTFVDENESTFFEQRYSTVLTKNHPCLADHQVAGKSVLAGTFLVSMALDAYSLATGAERESAKLTSIEFEQPARPEGGFLQLHITLQPTGHTESAFAIYQNGDPARQVATGVLTTATEEKAQPAINIAEMQGKATATAGADELYRYFGQTPVQYGPAFRSVKKVWLGEGQYLAELEATGKKEDEAAAHPMLLDAAMHALAATRLTDAADSLMVPLELKDIRLLKPLNGRLFAYGRIVNHTAYTVSILNEDGETVAGIGNIALSGRIGSESGMVTETHFFAPEWQEAALSVAGKEEVTLLAVNNSEQQEAVQFRDISSLDKNDLNNLLDGISDRLALDLSGAPIQTFGSYAAFLTRFFQTLVTSHPGRAFTISIGYRPEGTAADVSYLGTYGFLKSLCREYPRIQASFVEFQEPSGDVNSQTLLVQEARAASTVYHVRYANGQRLEQHVMPVEVQPTDSPVTDPDGIYLVTGGMGSLGRTIARKIARNGAEAIYLTGRKSLNGSKEKQLEELRSQCGNTVLHYVPCDVTDAAAVAQLRRQMHKAHNRIDGVIHAAGVLKDELLLNKIDENLQAVTSPKVDGALHLDEAFAEDDLDFFVLFSSIASLTGNEGQTDYAYANACLDEFAAYRNSFLRKNERRGRTISINWPLWDTDGMNTSAAHFQAARKEFGLDILSIEQGLEAFDLILKGKAAQVAPLPGDGARLLEALERAQQGGGKQDVPADSEAGSASKEDILGDIKAAMSATLRISPDTVSEKKLMEAYGIDSISMMEILHQLEDVYGKLPQTLFFECKTVGDLSSYIAKNGRLQKAIVREDAKPAPAAKAPAGKPAAILPTKMRRGTSPAQEDIAIIGVAGRYPKADNTEAFWNNLLEGRDAVEVIPASRWDYRKFYGKREEPGKSYGKWGGFINEATGFDSLFFNLSPKEAATMDPQERVFLETCWHVLENAGYTRDRLAKEISDEVGVFVGAMNHDFTYYNVPNLFDGDTEGLGSTLGAIANRVSYCLDLKGPSMVVDTMCSSSLTSLQLACESIKRGESRMAIAGGVNLILHPAKYTILAKAHFLSSEGKCRSFGEGGDGYVPGEGAGAVLLKPLSKAIEDKDHIWGVIKSVAVNHNGKSNGFTVPSPLAQAEVTTKAIKQAGIEPQNIRYIETHGTGTALGDPIEISGLQKAFDNLLPEKEKGSFKCKLGAVKSNVGHLEGAAGIAGLTKILLQFRHNTIVPSLHSQELNNKIDFEAGYFEVARQAGPVAAEGAPFYAGLSSFGAGGSNAHTIIQKYEATKESTASRSLYFIPLSARTQPSLHGNIRQLHSFLKTAEDTDSLMPQLEYTLCYGREQMEERAVFIVCNAGELIQKLESFLSGIRSNGKDIFSNAGSQGKADLEELFTALGLDDNLGHALTGMYASQQLQKLAGLWVKGLHLPWSSIFRQKEHMLPLPGYAFERMEFPLPPLQLHSRNASESVGEDPEKTFVPLPDEAGAQTLIKINLAAEEEAFSHHVVEGEAILAAACQAALMLRAMEEKRGAGRLTDVVLKRKITRKDLEQMYLRADEETDGRISLSLAVYQQDRLNICTTAGWQASTEVAATDAGISASEVKTLRKQEVYAKFEDKGVRYGSHYRLLRKVSLLEDGSVSSELEEGSTAAAVLDAGLQSLVGITLDSNNSDAFYYPYSLEEIQFGEKLIRTRKALVTNIKSPESGTLTCDIVFYDADENVTGRVSGLKGVKPGVRPAADSATAAKVTSGTTSGEGLHEYLREMLAGYLSVPKAKLKADTHLEAFGLNSVMILELTAKLEERFPALPKTLFFEYQTISEIASFLNENYPAEAGSDKKGVKVSPASDLALAAKRIVTWLQNKARKTVSGTTSHDRDDDAIAIIGMDGRFPQADNLEEFWQNLVQQKDCITHVPENRKGFTAQDRKSFYGGFLKDIESFDPLFFNIAPSQAEVMDPQERIFLETAWKTVENASYTRADLAAQKVGVYVGAMYSEYQLYGPEVSRYAGPVALTGTQASIANRVSAVFDLNGPSMTLDTMCSSALTAIHLACQSIRSGETDMALAGGVNLLLHPNKYVMLGQGNFLSPEGKCRSFGKDGSGYVPGEGVGCVLLKPYKKAIEDHDHIYGVLESTAVNHGGRTSGYTVPSPVAQRKVIEDALSRAAISPEQISYVEAHGTGTSLGDPIEIEALTKAYKSQAKENQYCAIGSVKSNIGHCESAAGMAGLFKILLQYRHRYKVPSIHAEVLNPNIDFENTPFYVQQKGENTEAAPGYSALSSFGAGGSNAHFIIKAHETTAVTQPEEEEQVIVLSARTSGLLKEQAAALLNYLQPAGAEEKYANPASAMQANAPEGFIEEVHNAAAAVLNVTTADLQSDQPLTAYGLDANLSIEIKEKLEDTLGLTLPGEHFLRELSIIELAQSLIRSLPALAERYPAAAEPEAEAVPECTAEPALKSVAYSLQTGREAREFRMAIVCQTTNELKNELQKFLDGKASKAIVQGNIREDSLLVEALEEDESLIGKWVQRRALDKLCAVWVKGANIPWSSLYAGKEIPARVPLPTTVFERRSYWVTGWQDDMHGSVAAPGPVHKGISALLQENVSTLRSQRFRSRFTGEEFFLRDHRIGGRAVLPGAAYLAMIHQAVSYSLESEDFTLSNLVFLQPFDIEGAPREIEAELSVKDNGLHFEIYSSQEGQRMLHCQGRIVEESAQSTPQPFSFRDFINKGEELSVREMYSGFEALDFHYGPEFRLLKSLYSYNNEALGSITNPEQAAYRLHPAVTDACFQACSALSGQSARAEGEVYLPFSLKKVVTFNKAAGHLYVHVKPSAKGHTATTMSYDLLLMDDTGRPAVHIEEFTLRKLTMPKPARTEDSTQKNNAEATGKGIVYPAFKWEKTGGLPLQTVPAKEKVWIYSDGTVSEELAKQVHPDAAYRRLPELDLEAPESLLNAFKEAFLEVKEMFTSHGKVKKRVVFFLENRPELYGIYSGLLKTATIESPLLKGKVVYLDEAFGQKDLAELVSKELGETAFAPTVRYTAGKQREVEKLEITAGPVNETAYRFREGGVYWIPGGMGGIGKVLARYMASQSRCTIILSGRRSPDEKIEAELKSLRAGGLTCEYVPCDLADEASVQNAFATIKAKHPRLHGIIHSAGVTSDAFILKKEVSELDKVMPAKIAGALYLDQVAREEQLDFFCLFSSLASVNGNFGQSDYAGANAFLDQFAAYRQELTNAALRHGHSLSINWPLWKDGGMGVDPEVEEWMVKKADLMPLSNEEGMQIFSLAMASSATRIIPVKILGEKAYGFLNVEAPSPEASATASTPAKAEPDNHAAEQAKPPAASGPANLDEAIGEVIKEVLVASLKIRKEDILAGMEFSDLGVDSIQMIGILDKLEEQFDTPFDPNSIIQYPTVEALAEHIRTLEGANFDKLPAVKDGAPRETEEVKPVAVPAPSANGHSTPRPEAKPSASPFKALNKLSYNGSANGKAEDDRIAIIACASRFPESPDNETFWKNLAQGKELISEIPEDRWPLEGFYDPENRDVPNRSYTKHAGFVKDIEYFDPAFFNISETDALVMDPQHRIIMELCQELFDRAGYRKSDLKQSRTGIYLGAKEGTYLFNNKNNVTADQQQHMLVNSLANMMAARVSNFYDLKGTSQTIDTACSSSLVATYDAVRSLLSGESDMAVAGGIFLMQDPFAHVSFSKAQVLSPDGHSYVFDKRAKGFVLGEGAGLVMMKRYQDAMRDGDRIMGVIRGIAVNNDGYTMGVTVPNQKGQKEVIQKALKQSKVDPRTISYYEVHGTGTLLGDPIEIKAATEAYRGYTDDKGYCAIGSVKSNMGHAITAAGVAGLIKVLLAMQAKQIPPTLNCEQPHPRFRFHESPFFPNTELREWEPVDGVRRAALSSFGFGGTNAHLIIEEPPAGVNEREGVRKPLPLTKFNRKAFWLGREYAEADDETIKNILSSLVSDSMDLEDAFKALT